MLCSREWYSYHFPELYKIVPEQALYAKLVKIIKSRKSVTEETVDHMEEILNDRSKAQAVYEASKSSMGEVLVSTISVSAFHFVN